MPVFCERTWLKVTFAGSGYPQHGRYSDPSLLITHCSFRVIGTFSTEDCPRKGFFRYRSAFTCVFDVCSIEIMESLSTGVENPVDGVEKTCSW